MMEVNISCSRNYVCADQLLWSDRETVLTTLSNQFPGETPACTVNSSSSHGEEQDLKWFMCGHYYSCAAGIQFRQFST